MGWKEASTLMVMALKDKPFASLYNYKVLMLKRSDKSSFMPKGFVFPGGMVEKFDSNSKWLELFAKYGFSESSLQSFAPDTDLPPIFTKKPDDGVARELSLRISAIRETFEETGVLLARKINNVGEKCMWGEVLDSEELSSWRPQVQEQPSKFLDMCEAMKCVPDIWSLKLWSNWLTPPEFPKRFDTVFYTACLPQEPKGTVDTTENEKLEWFSPERLLRMSQQRMLWLPPPQVYEVRRIMQFCMLEDLAHFAADREHLGCALFGSFRLTTNEGMIFPLPGDDTMQETNVDKYADCNFEQARKQCTHLHRMEIFESKPTRVVAANFVPGHGHIAPVVDEGSNSTCCKI